MNNQQQFPTYNKHPSLQNLFITKEGNNIVKEFKAGSESQLTAFNYYVYLQKEYSTKHRDYVLGIKNIQEQKRTKQILVIYDCDISAIPLSKDKSIEPKHQIQIFKNLYQIYGFLNKENILHRNLKPNNIIFYKNQLLLTDLSYKEGEYCIDIINFSERVENMTHKDNMHPYISQEIADIINTRGNIQEDELRKRNKQSIKRQDQYAIAIMMLEVFLPLEDRSFTPINERKQQINSLNLSYEFSSEDVTFIKNTISDLLEYKDFNQIDFENTLNKISQIESQIHHYKINKQVLMKQKNQELIQQCLENNDFIFDLNLLYYFSLEELKNKYFAIQNENEALKGEIKRLLMLSQFTEKQRLDINESDLNQLGKEDLFLLLVYLDEKIENLKIDELSKKIIYHNMKRLLKPYYQKINNLTLNQFGFNNVQSLKKSTNNIIEGQNNTNFQEKNINNSQMQFTTYSEGINIHNQQEINYDQQTNNDTEVQEDQIPDYPIPNNQIPNNQNPDNPIPGFVIIRNYSQNKKYGDLQQTIPENFQNLILQKYFSKQFFEQSEKTGFVYKHKDNSNRIYQGQFNKNNFEGEVIEVNAQTIKHFYNVTTNSNQEIQDKENQSSIYYHQKDNSPQMFTKIKVYFGGIKNGQKNGKGQEKNIIENMSYKGNWKNDQMEEGTKQIISTEYILQNTPYKWQGNFHNNQLNGVGIKTYLLNWDREMWYEGRYQNNLKKGTHICYTKDIDNQKVQLFKEYFIVLNNQELSFKLFWN